MINRRPKVVIADYGVGNRGSMRNMILSSGGIPHLSSNKNDILGADRIVLPGVGAFDGCMRPFRDKGFEEILWEAVHIRKIPLLGVCVGMQMLFDCSEEGVTRGLGWIEGTVRHLSNANIDESAKIPNMGWSRVSFANESHVSQITNKDNRFYFAHSYYCEPSDQEKVYGHINYGGKEIPVAVKHKNIVAVQFHPEKSHVYGRTFINRFLFDAL